MSVITTYLLDLNRFGTPVKVLKSRFESRNNCILQYKIFSMILDETGLVILSTSLLFYFTSYSDIIKYFCLLLRHFTSLK